MAAISSAQETSAAIVLKPLNQGRKVQGGQNADRLLDHEPFPAGPDTRLGQERPLVRHVDDRICGCYFYVGFLEGSVPHPS